MANKHLVNLNLAVGDIVSASVEVQTRSGTATNLRCQLVFFNDSDVVVSGGTFNGDAVDDRDEYAASPDATGPWFRSRIHGVTIPANATRVNVGFAYDSVSVTGVIVSSRKPVLNRGRVCAPYSRPSNDNSAVLSGDADTLVGNGPAYYLDYSNFSNTPPDSYVQSTAPALVTGTIWFDTGSSPVVNATQIDGITVDTAGLLDNYILKYDLATTSWKVEADATGAGGDGYLSGLSFAAGTGIITATMTGVSNQTVDISGLDVALLNSQNAAYYLNYDNFTNTPPESFVQSTAPALVTGTIWFDTGSSPVVDANTLTIGGHFVDDIDITSEYSGADDHLMSSAAINARIQDYSGNYLPVGGSVTADVAVRELHLVNQEPTSLTADGYFGYDASIGLMVYKTQNYGDAGHTNGVYMVLDTGNIATGASLELSGNGVTTGGTSPLTISVASAYQTNWDAAYDDKVNSASFNTGDGVLTLTRQDAGTVTVDLDGRYSETGHTHSYLNYYGTHLDANDAYIAGYNTTTDVPVIGVDINSTSSTNFPTEFGATWGFKANSGNDAPDWQRQFEIHKTSDASGDGLYIRGRDGTTGAPTTWNRLFHDSYHPNADKWTNSRTLTLTGDVTGSVTFDGSAAINMTNTVVADDSHSHSNYLSSNTADDKTSGDLKFLDNIGCRFGTGGDSNFFFNGTNLYLDFDVTNPDWLIRNTSNVAQFTFEIDTGRFITTGEIESGSNMEVPDAGYFRQGNSIYNYYQPLNSSDSNRGTMSSISHMSFIADANNNGTGNWYWMEGATTHATATQVMLLNSTTGDLTLSVASAEGTATDWIATSDERLKKNIDLLDPEYCLYSTLNLKPITHEWIEGKEGTYNGFIAQQVEKIDPSLVSENEQGIKSVSYMKAVPVLTGAIQALYARLQILESKLNG